MSTDPTALIVVDMQRGFSEPGWGVPNNPACERNVVALVAAWRTHGQPLVVVRHDSHEPDSPLRPGQPGNELMPELAGADLLVVKSVNSSFHGSPDLEAWLRAQRIGRIAICGIQTNTCCETTARVGANLGFDMSFVLDATRTFDRPAYGGGTIVADELARVTATNLDPEFGRVVTTRDAMAALER